MKITRSQLRRIIREAHGGASVGSPDISSRRTAGATPTRPMTPEEQQRVFDMLADSGSDPKELKATGDYPDVDSMSSEVARRYLKRKYDWLEDIPQEEIHPLDVNRDGKLTISEIKITRRQLRQMILEHMDVTAGAGPGAQSDPKRETEIGLDLSKIKNIVIEGIDMADYPDFSDAFVASAEYEYAPREFRDLTEEEIDYLNENEDEWVWNQVWEQVN